MRLCVRETITQFKTGLITATEFMNLLEALQVRGILQPSGQFIGYDYHTQKWLKRNFK